MADSIYKAESSQKGMSPVTIAFLGAVAGAVGTGVAIALSNPKNRKKVQQTMHESQEWMNKTIHDLKHNAPDAKDVAKELGEKVDDIKPTSTTRAAR